MEKFSLKNKVAVVTGAGGLLGAHHCKALAEAGAVVVACDINSERTIKANPHLNEGKHQVVAFDISDKSACQEVADMVEKEFGRLDILVNNAAINDMFENPEAQLEQSKFENYPLELWEKSLQVNVTGMYLTSQVFGALIVRSGGGSIINVASTYGMVGPDQSIYIDESGKQAFFKTPSYPVTKGAVLNFTRYLAAYWGPQNVRVNSLSPGGVENGQDEWFVKNYSAKTVLGRMAQPSDYEGALVFLASDASSYMTGANLVVDGGWTAI